MLIFFPATDEVLAQRPATAIGSWTSRPYNDGVRYGIIADDLTGSCDAAGRLTHLGYRPIVRLRAVGSGTRRSPRDTGSAVVVVNARSRASSQDGAVALVRSAAEDLERAGWSVVYYKMDSTLRGYWPEELDALESLLQPARVLVCPAFPARGRFYRDGRLELRKELRLDFRATLPAGGSASLRHDLKEQLGHFPHHVPLEVVRRGQQAVRAAVKASNSRYAVFDATREGDLEVIGKAFRNSKGRILWAGSAGLVRYVLPRLAQPESGPSPTPCPTGRRAERPWLLIQGSRQQIGHEQFHRLGLDDRVLSIRFQQQSGRKDLRRWYDAAMASLAARQHVAIAVPRDFGLRLPEEFAGFLERLFRGFRRGRRLGGIFVSGGSTAETVCDGLHATATRVIGEVGPGIARSVLLDGSLPGLPFITKAGGFGEPDEIHEILKEMSS